MLVVRSRWALLQHARSVSSVGSAFHQVEEGAVPLKTVVERALSQTRGERSVAVLGLPTDRTSRFLSGAAGAPAMVRAALNSSSLPLATERGVPIPSHQFCDLGDLCLDGANDVGQEHTVIEEAADVAIRKGFRLVGLGGDRAVTFPLLRSCAKHYPGLSVLHFSSTMDSWHMSSDSSIFEHPIARSLMEGLVGGQVTHIGTRGLSESQLKFLQNFPNYHAKFASLPATWKGAGKMRGPLYISLDMTCLDPSVAPGVSAYDPGGLTIRQVLGLIRILQSDIVAIDVVEFNPRRDVGGGLLSDRTATPEPVPGMTATTAARFVKDAGAFMISGPQYHQQSGNGKPTKKPERPKKSADDQIRQIYDALPNEVDENTEQRRFSLLAATTARPDESSSADEDDAVRAATEEEEPRFDPTRTDYVDPSEDDSFDEATVELGVTAPPGPLDSRGNFDFVEETMSDDVDNVEPTDSELDEDFLIDPKRFQQQNTRFQRNTDGGSRNRS